MARALGQYEYVLHTYKVTYGDGTVDEVLGRWPAHAWSVASHLRPNQTIKDLALVRLGSSTIDPAKGES